ncbi:hypothetical protein HMPREF9412_2434 [Paenibacillus sp. HGF5]|nr:hypothetical protein HMPREF9412_2434 [Paenibacillus sp. HGF5]
MIRKNTIWFYLEEPANSGLFLCFFGLMPKLWGNTTNEGKIGL